MSQRGLHAANASEPAAHSVHRQILRTEAPAQLREEPRGNRCEHSPDAAHRQGPDAAGISCSQSPQVNQAETQDSTIKCPGASEAGPLGRRCLPMPCELRVRSLGTGLWPATGSQYSNTPTKASTLWRSAEQAKAHSPRAWSADARMTGERSNLDLSRDTPAAGFHMRFATAPGPR